MISNKYSEEITAYVASRFRMKHPDINILNESGNLDKYTFYTNYYEIYRTKESNLFKAQNDRKRFLAIIDKYLDVYFTNEFIRRV